MVSDKPTEPVGISDRFKKEGNRMGSRPMTFYNLGYF